VVRKEEVIEQVSVVGIGSGTQEAKGKLECQTLKQSVNINRRKLGIPRIRREREGHGRTALARSLKSIVEPLKQIS
jgi:hypothetical protein